MENPGRGVFQMTFSVSDHLVGGLALGYLPVPSVRHPTGDMAKQTDDVRKKETKHNLERAIFM